MQRYQFRVEVQHDGKKYGKGSECPAGLVKTMQEQGLVEPWHGGPSLAPSAESVNGPKGTALQPTDANQAAGMVPTDESEEGDEDTAEAGIEGEDEDGDESEDADEAAPKKLPPVTKTKPVKNLAKKAG